MYDDGPHGNLKKNKMYDINISVDILTKGKDFKGQKCHRYIQKLS